MPFNGSGTFNPAITFQANTPATAADQNTQDADIASGLSNCITRNGQSPATANIPMGGFKITGLTTGSASTDSITYGQVYGTGGVIPTGTIMLFFQAAAPAGWTQVTSINDYALRIVSGAGAGTTGSVGLSAWIAAGTTGHALSIGEMPSHNHGVNDPGHNHSFTGSYQGVGSGTNAGMLEANPFIINSNTTGISIQNNGGGAAHNHGFPALQYADLIQCSKN